LVLRPLAGHVLAHRLDVAVRAPDVASFFGRRHERGDDVLVRVLSRQLGLRPQLPLPQLQQTLQLAAPAPALDLAPPLPPLRAACGRRAWWCPGRGNGSRLN